LLDKRTTVLSLWKQGSEAGLLLFGCYLGLLLPDLDFLLLPILHHRSILTHSILLPFLVRDWLPKPLYYGILAGISVHLFADSLSPMRGFALVYWPVTKTSLGDDGSLVWLLVNGVTALALVFFAYRRVFEKCLVAFFSIGALYAVFNEGAIYFGYLLASIGLLAAAWRTRKAFLEHQNDKDAGLLAAQKKEIEVAYWLLESPLPRRLQVFLKVLWYAFLACVALWILLGSIALYYDYNG